MSQPKYARLTVAEVFSPQEGFTLEESFTAEVAGHFSLLPEGSPVGQNWGYNTTTGEYIVPIGTGQQNRSVDSETDTGNGNPPPN